MNKTLSKRVRSLLFTSDLNKSFWGKALATTTFLVNRSPNRNLGLKCPNKPRIDHLRIFGYAANAHNKDSKQDPKFVKCVFLGYQQQSETKGHRLWERCSHGVKIIINRDIVFYERFFPCKTTTQQQVPLWPILEPQTIVYLLRSSPVN